jgi:hypothetical protein
MAFIVNGVGASELPGSPTLDITHQGMEGQRIFWLNDPSGLEWIPFVKGNFGGWSVVGTLEGLACVYTPPIPFPGFVNLVPDRVRVEPFMPSSPAGEVPDGALIGSTLTTYPSGQKITIGYRTMYNVSQQRQDMPGVPTGTFLTYEADIGAEVLSTPGRTWTWVKQKKITNDKNQQVTAVVPTDFPAAAVDTDVSPGVTIPTGTFKLTWERVLFPPWGAIRALRGKVNSVKFMGCEPGTVMYLGAHVSRQYQFSDDAGFWKIEYMFNERSVQLNSGTIVGWNYFMRPVEKGGANGGENWCLIGATPTKEQSAQLAQLNAAAETQATLAEAAQDAYEVALDEYGPDSGITQSLLEAAQAGQAQFETAREAAEAAGGGLYAPPYMAADFTPLFQFPNNTICA